MQDIQPQQLTAREREILRLLVVGRSIKEIANELDFPNTSFFGKYVREHLGQTPMEYRRKYRKQD